MDMSQNKWHAGAYRCSQTFLSMLMSSGDGTTGHVTSKVFPGFTHSRFFLEKLQVEIQIPHCEMLLVLFKVGEDQSPSVKFPTG